MNLLSIAKQYADADSAREFFEKQRWPDGVVCLFCGLVGEAYRLKAKETSKSPVRSGVWKCKGCRKQFTVTKGTIFEGSHIPLNVWLLAIHLLCSSKKGMSAHQIRRMLGLTYKTAWFMVHRIRHAVTLAPLAEQLKGIVEIDETFIGGKFKNRNRRKLRQNPPERDQDTPAATGNKQIVVSMVERGGDVRSHHVKKANAAHIGPLIRYHIEYGARIMTDSGTVLHGSIHPREHDQVNHSDDEYARYEDGVCISTNTVEGYFSLVKRSILGTYHQISPKHLHRYLSEFDFRYNAKRVTDGERTCRMIRKTEGKRLAYKQLIA